MVPVYEGMEVIRQSHLDGSEGMEEYASRYYYEDLTFHVSNGQIVYAQWGAPLKTLSIENKNVQTISFEEAVERFRNQMQLEATASHLEDNGEGDAPQRMQIDIEKIELGLCCVRIQNNLAEYYLLPDWNFKGKMGVDYGERLFCESDLFESTKLTTFLTVNAWDGSIVNVNQGY